MMRLHDAAAPVRDLFVSDKCAGPSDRSIGSLFLELVITCINAALLTLVTISYHPSHLPSMLYSKNKHVYLPLAVYYVIICGVYTELLSAG